MLFSTIHVVQCSHDIIEFDFDEISLKVYSKQSTPSYVPVMCKKCRWHFLSLFANMIGSSQAC